MPKVAVQAVIGFLAFAMIAGPMAFLLGGNNVPMVIVWLPAAAWTIFFCLSGVGLLTKRAGWVPTRTGLKWYEGRDARIMGVIYIVTGIILIALTVILIFMGQSIDRALH